MKSATYQREVNRHAKRVQKNIQYCDTCQPYDGGSSVWILGRPIEMDDLLRDCNVPHEKWDDVISNLHCPYCGNEDLGLASTIGIKHKFEIEFEKLRSLAIEKHSNAILRFHKLLLYTPMLALKDSLGRLLRKEIKKYDNTISLSGDVYRAKKNEGEKRKPKVARMRPKKGYAEEGRFNHAGQEHLYLCYHEYHAESEITYNLPKPSGKVWVQKFNVIVPIENILDLTYEYEDSAPSNSTTLLLALFYTHTLISTKRNKIRWKPDYLITRFLTDAAKDAGFNGIQYNSARHTGKNIVLFREFEKVKAVKRPYLYESSDD